MTTGLDISRLENVRNVGGKIIARCPACAEAEGDAKGEHLVIQPDGRFGCINNQGPAGAEHRRRIFALVGIPNTKNHFTPRPPRTKPAPSNPAQTFASAKEAAEQCKPKGATLQKVYLYPKNGQEFGAVARYRIPGDKTFLQFHATPAGWSLGAPAGKWPLYREKELPATGLIDIFEGEKCVDAAVELGMHATCSAGGALAADRTDLKPLAGRDVRIWPDNNPPGESYADKIFKNAYSLNPPARVKIVRLPGLPDGGDIVDFIEARDAATPEDLRSEIEALAAQVQAKPPTGTLLGIDARLWLETEPPQPDQIFCDAFDTGDKVSVIGSSKMRKSFFVLQAALCIAAGRDFLTWKITKPRRVLLAQFEIKSDHFWRRVRNMARAMGISIEDIGDRLLIFNCRGITGETAIERIGEEAKKYRAEVIIFDPLYKLTEGDENAAKDMKPTLAAFDRLAEATGAAVIYVHHDAKGHAGDRDSRDRGAGSNIGRRDDDFCITITAHDVEESSIVIDCLWRNYKPREPFTASWTDRGCFEYMPDMPAVKKTSRSKSATTTARPEIETYRDAAMALVAKKPMAIALFREKIEAMAGMTQDRQKRLVEIMLVDGSLVNHHQRERGCHKAWIGTPEQIEEMRQIKLEV